MHFLTLLLRRARLYWQVLLTLILGVLLSAALLAAGPLLVQTVQNAALPFALRTDSVLDGNLQLSLHHDPDPAAYNQYARQIEQLVREHLRSVETRLVGGGSTSYLYPWVGGQLQEGQRIDLAFYQALPDEAVLVAGEWPGGEPLAPGADGAPRFAAAIGEGFAQSYGLEVGDELPLSPRRNDEQPAGALLVSGILRPNDSSQAVWRDVFNPLRDQTRPPYLSQYSALLPVEGFYAAASEFFPTSDVQSTWAVIVPPESLQAREVPAFLAEIASLQEAVQGFEARLFLNTNLPAVLEQAMAEAAGVQLPLYFLVLEVLLLALYYVLMVSGLYLRQVEGEFARFGSRGASSGQVFRLQAAEAGMLAMLGLALGPVLALLLLLGLASLGPYDQLTSGVLLRGSIPTASWLAAASGGLVLMAALLVPAVPAVRRGVVVHLQQRAREDRPPLWQRLYLDVLLLAGGLILLWRAQLTGGFQRLDLLLLIAPLALLLGTATILLRLFPPLLRLLARLTGRMRGLALPLALRQASRSPNHIARLVLLLTLTMALGLLATGLDATLRLSEGQRARYAVGGELRAAYDSLYSPGQAEARPDVRHAAGVWRTEASVNVRASRSFPTLEVLAVEPFALADVARFRADFAEEDMGLLLGRLVTDRERVAPVFSLEGQPERFGLWVGSEAANATGYRPLDYISLQAKIKTAQDQMLLVDLQPGEREPDMENDQIEWSLYSTVLPELDKSHYPLALHSLWFRAQSIPPGTERRFDGFHDLLLDDLLVAQPGEPFQVVEQFEDPARLWQTNDPTVIYASFTRAGAQHSGDGAVKLGLSEFSTAPASFSPANTDFNPPPIPALASPGFLQATGLSVGNRSSVQILGTTQAIDLVGTVDYFPTMYDSQDHSFLVVPYIPMLNRLNNALARPFSTNEIWMTLEPGAQIGAVQAELPGVLATWDVPQEMLRISSDPLVLGLRSVITLGTIVTFVLSLVGFITYFILSVRQRTTTYGVLRSLGMAPGQLYGALLVEQLVLIAAGLGLGVLMGLALNRLILPDLPLVLGDRPPVPPFIPQDDWVALLRIVAALALSYLAALAVGALLLWRTQVHRVLRIGEE